jgi:hypothetical protein
MPPSLDKRQRVGTYDRDFLLTRPRGQNEKSVSRDYSETTPHLLLALAHVLVC